MLYLNGHIISSNEARIEVTDRGFLLGDGLFETMACHQESVFNLEAHWRRLQKGADLLGLPLPFSLMKLREIIQQLISQNKIVEGVVRVTITRGNGGRGVEVRAVNPTVLITANTYEKNSMAMALCFSDIKINHQFPLTQIKTTNYLDKILAKQQAQRKNFDDALLLNIENRVVSTSSANIFFIKNNELYTPPIEEGVLPGTTRDILLNIAQEKNIPVHLKPIEKEWVLSTNEAFMTNCLIGIQPISQIEETRFSSEDFTTQLQKYYLTFV